MIAEKLDKVILNWMRFLIIHLVDVQDSSVRGKTQHAMLVFRHVFGGKRSANQTQPNQHKQRHVGQPNKKESVNCEEN